MYQKIVESHRDEFEEKRREFYVQRIPQIKNIESRLIQVIIGPRRAGKSFFSIKSVEPLIPAGYVNFDDERLAGLSDFDQLMEAVTEV